MLRAYSTLGIAALLLGPPGRAQAGPPTKTGRLPITVIQASLRDDLTTLRMRPGQPPASALDRLHACRRIRSWLEVPSPDWLQAVEFVDPNEPHWPASWQLPKTQRQRASMWLLLAELCDARRTNRGADQEREVLANGAQVLSLNASRCYTHVLQCGDLGHLLLLEKIARSEANLAISLMWRLKQWSQVPGLICPLARMPAAHSLLSGLAKSEQLGIRVPALQMLDQAMRFGAGDSELAEWALPLAREHLDAEGATFAFQEANGSMMQLYEATQDPGALVVSIASQLKPTTTAHKSFIRDLLARLEPHLKQPEFNDLTSDFAWKLATQIAPALSSNERARIETIVAAHASPAASARANRWIQEAIAALRLAPLQPPTWPDTSPTRTTDHVTRATQHPIGINATLRNLERNPRQRSHSQHALVLASRSLHPDHQVRAMGIAAKITSWSMPLEREVLHRTSSYDSAVRLAAYQALHSRDPQAWSCAWLVHEMAFDPEAKLRKVYWRWTKQ